LHALVEMLVVPTGIRVSEILSDTLKENCGRLDRLNAQRQIALEQSRAKQSPSKTLS
jgi:hypothetical protein